MSTYQRAPGALWRRSGDRVVVDCPSVDHALILAGPASEAWGLLAEPWTDEELTAALAERYGKRPEAVNADIVAMLDQLRNAGAITAG